MTHIYSQLKFDLENISCPHWQVGSGRIIPTDSFKIGISSALFMKMKKLPMPALFFFFKEHKITPFLPFLQF